MTRFGTLATASVAVTGAVAGTLAPRASLPAVTIKGNAFFAGNDRFYIRGIDYQPGGSSDPIDPLADTDTCTRDIAEFTKLGINTLRVYTIDNSKNHDACMNALANAGIYLALDVNSPNYSINRADAAPSYNHVYLQNIFATVDMFHSYTNLLMFFSGNEIINDVPTSASAPYIKAVTRDLKQYIGNRQYRQIPVGYSAADIDDNRVETAHYMNCGTDDQRVDFFAFNDYSWCDPSTYTTSTWSDKVAEFGNYSQPIFLSEYGCTKTARKFQEVATLYGTNMTPVYSGGLVYQYTVEGDATQQKFGLVQITNGNAVEQPDFATLESVFKNNPLPTGDGGYKPSGDASICPAASATWLVGNDTLPAMPPQASQYFKNGAGTGPGLNGSSMDVGVETTATATAGSGQPTTTGQANAGSSGPATSSKAAACNVRVPEFSTAPYVCGLVVLMSTLLGATLL